MSVRDVYEDVKDRAVELRKSILNKIFDSRFNSMLDAIEKSARISKTLGENISFRSSEFKTFGKPLKVVYPTSADPTLNDTDDRAITPVWTGDTDSISVNGVSLDVISMPEMELEPEEMDKIIKKLSGSLTYGIILSEPYDDAKSGIYDLYDWSRGYFLPSSIGTASFNKFRIVQGALVSPAPVETTVLNAILTGAGIKEFIGKCWMGNYYVVAFSKEGMGTMLILDIFTDCRLTIVNPLNETQVLSYVSAPIIVSIVGINYNNPNATIKISNVGELPLGNISIGDVYAYIATSTPFYACIKIGSNATISCEVGHTCE